MATKLSLALIHLLIAAAGIGILLLMAYSLIISDPPIKWESGSVRPVVVRAGDWFEVSRSYTTSRVQAVEIHRELVEANCVKSCAKFTLPGSGFTTKIGREDDGRRFHQVPNIARPGEYLLKFELRWENFIGRTYSDPLPVLRIEVVP